MNKYVSKFWRTKIYLRILISSVNSLFFYKYTTKLFFSDFFSLESKSILHIIKNIFENIIKCIKAHPFHIFSSICFHVIFSTSSKLFDLNSGKIQIHSNNYFRGYNCDSHKLCIWMPIPILIENKNNLIIWKLHCIRFPFSFMNLK